MLTHDARRLTGVITLCLLLAACSNQVAGSPIGTGQIVDSDPAPRSGTSSADPGPPPTPTIPNFPEAADGTDINACYDGTCEVDVRAPIFIPMDPALGVTGWTLERIDNDGGAVVTARTTDGAGRLEAKVYADPGTGGATGRVNGWQVTAVATANGRAVLRFTPP